MGGGGGEGIVRLDLGPREATGRGCGRVGAGRAACSHWLASNRQQLAVKSCLD